MRKTLLVAMLWGFCATLLHGGEHEAQKVKVALELARARTKVQVAPETETVKEAPQFTYSEACRAAQQRKLPLAVFVNQPAKKLEGWIVCEVPALESQIEERVYVARPGEDWPQILATLPGRPGKEEIIRAWRTPAVFQTPPRSYTPITITYPTETNYRACLTSG